MWPYAPTGVCLPLETMKTLLTHSLQSNSTYFLHIFDHTIQPQVVSAILRLKKQLIVNPFIISGHNS